MRGLARRARGWQEGKRRRPIENQEPPFNHPHRHPPCSVAAAGTRRKERDREAAKNDCATRAKMTNCTAPVSLLVCLDLECGRGKYVVKTTPENWGRIIASVLCDRKQRSQSTDSSVLFICLPPAPFPPSPLPSPQSPIARAAHVERSGISFFGPLPRLARPVAKNKASLRRKRGRYQGETRLAVVQPTEGGNEGEAVQIAREGGGGRRGGGVAWQSGPSRRK